MAIRVDEPAVDVDETYWVAPDAAPPVLLIDEATEAITAALHRVRRGSVLGERDLTAAGTALGDLFGGLGQLAEELSSHGHQADRLGTLRTMTLSAQRVADGLGVDEAVPRQRV